MTGWRCSDEVSTTRREPHSSAPTLPGRMPARSSTSRIPTIDQVGARFYSEDEDFKLGLDRIEKAIALAPNGRLIVEDPENDIHNADELRAELAAGLRTEASDLNPMRIFRKRK